MKRIASLLPFLLLILSTAAVAQPVVSYITPDIGAAGMNSYVEIIGPSTTTGNFGTDGLYSNATNDAVRVYPTLITDTNFVLIGPLVVSWNGRMISTQVFVRPNAPSGTIVNLTVNRGGQVSNPIPFEIVTPQNLPALTGGGVLGSGGNFGTRSKRGAMIVSSLTLNSGSFSVSTADPDNVIAGNQGYLPFILISKGPIRIQSGVTLNVNAATLDGGAGGGGGGGKVADRIASGPTDGGQGYTGGGAGSYNGSSNSFKNPGVSTGSNGASLNGAVGGKSSASCAENSSGGTGHPFGTGGETSCPGTIYAAGGYGGGGGAPQNVTGGGGGYGSQGASAPGSGGAVSAGKIHGNDMGVPVAGGSGGASGNPLGILPTTAGAGGGGGGAIALYSMGSLNNSGTIEAKGAAGGTGTPVGGPGSGGYIGLGTKVGTPSVGGPVSVAGGGSSGAGAGRIRGDGFTASGPTTGTGGTRYVGVTIDSLTYVQSRNFTLRGTYGQISNATVRVYMKSDNSPGWTQLGAPTLTGGNWSLPFIATAGAGNYYFVAMQAEPSNATGQYDAEPAWVLSQAAANIVKVELVARINTDKTVANFADIVCETERVDSVKVWNSGEDILRITPAPSLARGNQFFTLLTHTAPFTLAPDSAVFIKIRYAPPTFGTNSDTLVLINNDPNPGKNPTKVTLNGRKLKIRPFFDQAEFDFGDVCVDSTVTRSIWFRYEGDAGVTASYGTVTRVGTGPANFMLTPPSGRNLTTRDSIELRIQFRPTAAGIYTEDYEVTVGPCNIKVPVKVKARGTKTEATFMQDPINIGDVRLNKPAGVPFRVLNSGSVSGVITKVFFKNPDPAFVLTNDPTGRPLDPAQTANGAFNFTPTGVQDYQIELCVVISGPCPDTTCVTVKGRGVTSLLVLSRKEDTLVADKCVEPSPAVTDTVRLYNQGTASARIDDPITSVKGLVTATATPGLPVDLAPDGSIEIKLSWTPTAVGTFTDTLRITTQSEDPKQRLILLPVTLIRNRVDLSLLKGDGSPLPLPNEIDLGDIYTCTAPFKYDLMLRNAGTLNDTLNASLASGTNYTLTPPVLPYVVEAASSKAISVTFNATAQGVYRDTLRLKSLVCPNDSFIVAFRANFVTLDYSAPALDFGNKNITVSFPGVATLTNTSTSPSSVRYKIDSARIEPSTAPFTLGTPVVRNVEIAPNEVFSQNVIFTPPAVGNYAAELWVFVGGPCPDTIKIPLTGRGIQSNVLVQPGGLNFGTKYLCENDSTLIVTVKNTGQAPFNITGVSVDGADKLAFELTRSPQPVPSPVAPQQIDTIVIRFVPGQASADGLLRATLTIKTDDGTNPEVTVDLVGERRRQVLSTPSNLDFGRVEVGESDTLEIQLDNRTTDPLTISDLSILPPFELLDMPDPVTLPPMGSIKVRVRFTPTDSTKYDEPIVVAQSSPCVDTTRLAVKGEGKITPVGTVEIVIPLDVVGSPGERIAIPIVMQKAIALAETGVTTFEAIIRFNRTLLIPIGVRSKTDPIKKAVAGASGSILDTMTVGNQKVMKIRITNSPMILQPDTLGFIDALVVLGDAVSTPIVIDTLYWTDGLVKGTRRDGLFTLTEYCDESTARLIRITNEFGIKRAVPNPFNPTTEIIFETVESGATTLQIYDSYGRLVETLVDHQDLPVQTHAVTWSATGAASGLYYAVLVTPTQRSVHTLMLVK